MITVVGEALVDLVISPDGEVAAALGGAPFNTARAAARLGADVEFVGALSEDRFGQMLASRLLDDGVDVSAAPRVTLPTTLAAAELDEGGAASYRFYIDGTSAPNLTRHALGASKVLFTGGLGLVLEPMATVIEEMVAEVGSDVTVMVDVNCRPMVIPDRGTYAARVERVVAEADIVKASDDDLAFLFPGVAPAAAAQGLIEMGARLVVVTTGGRGVDVVTAERSVYVPVEPVVVVDTVGAGDTFDGALLAWLTANDGMSDVRATADIDVAARAVRAASVAAGIACTRRGADPPSRDDLGPDWWT